MATIELTAADSGKRLAARPGDEILVRLAENPSTAYLWHVERIDGPLEATGDEYVPDAPAQVGSGGTRLLRYRAGAAGTARLALLLRRPWEDAGTASERFAAEIDVVD